MGRISRRRFMESFAGAAGAVAWPGVSPAAEAGRSGAGVNLVFVMADQMRGQAMGFLGEEPVLTPHLDRFAEQSLVLTQAASNYPVCSPYRAMLMTGRWPHANKVLSNCNSRTAPYDCRLQASDRCWSDVLASKGYSLGYIGKWHLEAPYKPYVRSYNNSAKFAWNEWCPPSRRHGFDFWYAYNTFDRHLSPEYWTTNMRRDEREKINRWGPEHETDLAVRYIRNEGGRFRRPGAPFALVVSFNPPHTPYGQVPQRYVARYEGRTWKDLLVRKNVDLSAEAPAVREAKSQIRNYFAMITGVDEQFGRIVRAIDEAGLGERTIVVFTSDHGNCLGSHNQRTKNVHWEESMRVPLLVRWRGRIRPRRDGLLLSTPDLYPTLLELMGFGADIPPAVQGVSHAGLFLTGRGPRPTSQPYMWIPPDKPALGRRGVRTARYTLVVTRSEGRKETVALYDNAADPFQLRDIAAERPEVVRRLTETELIPWLKRMGDPWLKS